jgi:outer membrane protein assembly factor BamB
VAVVPGNWQSGNLKGVSTSNGATLWTHAAPGLHGSPVITGDKVVFTDYNGQIYCINLADGLQVWTRDLGGGRSASTPAVAFGTVVAGGTGSVKGFRFSDGQQLWSFPLGASALKMAPYDNTYGALAGSPTIADHIAYVPCGDGKLYALTLETGQLQWSTDFGVPLLSAPCISGEMLYLSAFDGNVYALTSEKSFAIVPDFDADLDVDQADFGHFQACLAGSGVSPGAGCHDADLNRDGHADSQDVTVFLHCMSGADQPADPACSSG